MATRSESRRRRPRAGGARAILPPPRIGAPGVRHRLLLVGFLVIALVLSGRLVWIQGLNSSSLAQEAVKQRSVERTIPALRGDIVDRRGTPLATSVERYDLWVDQRQVPQFKQRSKKATVKGVEAAARELAPVLGWTVAEAKAALTGKKGFKYLDKNVEPAVRDAVMALKVPGVGADRVADRLYPAGSVGGNILGFVGGDGAALAGAELSYDDQLRGRDGIMRYERGAGGQIIPTGKQEKVDAVDGQGLVLTIDRDLQWKAQQIVASSVEQFGVTGGSAVVLNARTGEVLALAEYPTYDPNDPGRVPAEQLGNRSISDVFEPGSTGKLFTMAAALEEGTATPTSHYTVSYEQWFDGQRVKDSHHHPRQRLTLAGILKDSSNTGTVQVGETLTPKVRYDYLKKFGLGQKTGVGLPGESSGVVHPPEKWTGRTRFTTAFGQGYSVTALQMVSAVGAFANDGVRVHPRIVKGLEQADGSVRPLGEPERSRVVSSKTAGEMVRLMDTATDDGKSAARVPNYAVAGKTGTAQVPDGTYTPSFIGFAPADDPEIVVGVFLFGMKTFVSGARAAAPAFSELMSFTLQSQGIAPTGQPAREYETEW